ncbi:MAG: VOC family protein [Steroidobacteraceae bacterium]
MAVPAGGPRISRIIPFYYYESLDAAVEWYCEVIGLRKAWDGDWVVLLETTPGNCIGLVDSQHGAERAIGGVHKGALLAIETPALEQWHEKLTRAGCPDSVGQIGIATDGLTERFIVRDPGGYQVEFFRWRQAWP